MWRSLLVIELCGYGLRAESPRSQLAPTPRCPLSQLVCRSNYCPFPCGCTRFYPEVSKLTCQFENIGQLA